MTNKTVLMYEPSGKGGLARYSMNLCKALQEIGLRVVLITASPYEFIDKAKDSYKVDDRLRYMTTERIFLKFKPFWAADRLYRVLYNANLRNKIANRLMPDIIHLQITVPIIDVLYIPVLARNHSIVYTVHDVIRHTDGLQNRPRLLRRIYQAVDHIIVHTRLNKAQLARQFNVKGEKITVIPHGIEPCPCQMPSQPEARRILNIPHRSRVLLFFGTIRQNKGLDILLKAMPDVLVSHPDVKLLISGSLPRGVDFTKYKRIIQELNIKDNIITDCRFIPEDQMPLSFLSADVIVLPYHQFASQSGVLMQAYTYERPVVVTDVGGLGETVQEDKTGLVVSPESPEALAEAINILLDSGKLYSEFAANMSEARVGKYDWHSIARKTREVYEAVIASKEGASIASD